ncbi:MAG: hypothetical protein RPU62_15740 [Candidatus Sedimenticola sp. (ex Thyasira tokunagai)]
MRPFDKNGHRLYLRFDYNSFLLHLQFSFGALRARRVSSAASRLPGITSPRFALHGWQRL